MNKSYNIISQKRYRTIFDNHSQKVYYFLITVYFYS